MLRCPFDKRALHGHPMQVDWKEQRKSSEGGMSNGCPMDVHWTGGLDRTVGQAWSVRVECPMDILGTSWGHPGDIHWAGKTIPNGQRILMANSDMSDTLWYLLFH